MENNITRWKVEHLMKVAIWKQSSEHHLNPAHMPWMYLFFCGSNILCFAETMEELKEQMQEFADLKMLPKVIYTPPQRHRWEWFDEDFEANTRSSQLEYEASVTCVGPVAGGVIGAETYEFSPWHIALVSKEDLRESFYAFCLCRSRIRINVLFVLPTDIMKLIWWFLRTTTNTGFVHGDSLA